jgi:hypothetical protein
MANCANRRSRSNVTPVHVSVIPLGRAWSPLGVLRLVSLRTSHCKSRSNVTPVNVCYNCAQIEKSVGKLRKSPKSLKRYACACFGDFIGRLLESSGCPQAGFAQNVSLQKSLKRYACAVQVAKVAQTLHLCMFR